MLLLIVLHRYQALPGEFSADITFQAQQYLKNKIYIVYFQVI